MEKQSDRNSSHISIGNWAGHYSLIEERVDSMHSFMDMLCTIKKGVRTKRISSYDKTGGNGDCRRIDTGGAEILADITGSGIIKHIWFTVACEDPMYRRKLVLRMYWNNEKYPSVLCPLGDFFGQGWGEHYNYVSLPLCASPQDGKALNCYFPMPFIEGARIEIENQCDVPVDAFYFYIDYEEHERLPADTALFHADWRREFTKPEGGSGRGENEWCVISEPFDLNPSVKNNFVFADIEGAGHFVGIHYYVDCPSPMWYGEGDDMWLIDGEPWPGSLHGTGTEDFFNSSWCPNQIYSHPFFGYARIPEQRFGWLGRTHCYRFFLQDPIYFEKSLHASIEHGHANVLSLDLCTVAYWYQTEPHQAFRALPAAGDRLNRPEITQRDVHLWRDAWRRETGPELGTEALWGNETKPRK